MADESPARITRVKLQNYKSIVSCDVKLRPLTILVGPNGSGKSNFLDALRFVSEALTVGLEQAIRNRGNVRHILSAARPPDETWFAISLNFRLESGRSGHYLVAIQDIQDVGFAIQREKLVFDDWPAGASAFSVQEDGTLSIAWDVPPAELEPDQTTRHYRLGRMPEWAPDRLILSSYVFRPEVLPVYELLTSMLFANPIASEMRQLRPHDPGGRLLPDGENVASILRRAAEADDPELLERLTSYLAHIQPGLREIRAEDLGGYDLMALRQDIANEPGWWDARPDQLSDGTLRALGILVALFQGRLGGKSATSLVGVEEPEGGLHPAAANVLAGALADASYTTQVIATTHSADMLHMGEVDPDNILAVSSENGVTSIGPIDDVSRSVIRDRLFTIGELVQADQIRPRGVGSAVYRERIATEPSVTGS